MHHAQNQKNTHGIHLEKPDKLRRTDRIWMHILRREFFSHEILSRKTKWFVYRHIVYSATISGIVMMHSSVVVTLIALA